MDEFTGSDVRVVYTNRIGSVNILQGRIERCTSTLVILIDHYGMEHKIRKCKIKKTIIFAV